MNKQYPSSPGVWVSRSRITLKLVLKHILAPIGLLARSKTGVRILFYHRVNTHAFNTLGLVSREISVRTESFEFQMSHLAKRGFKSITLEECRAMLSGAMPIDPKAILLTFDDGYADNLLEASPILRKYGFTAVVFPVLEMIGQNNRCWPMSDTEGLGDFMTDEQLKIWLAEGHEIGSHTLTHPVLTRVDDTLLKRELLHSRQGFEEKFGRKCESLAYPNGDVDSRVANGVRDAGYELGFTTRSGLNSVGSDLALLNRTEVSASDSRLIFVLKMRGMFDWLGARDTVFYRKVMRVLNKVVSSIARAPKVQTQ